MYEIDLQATASHNICLSLADMPMTDVANQARLAWEYHDRMRQRYNPTWNTLNIELPFQQYRVTQELVDKINLVVNSAPTWGVVEVAWPPRRSVNGVDVNTNDLILCRSTLPGNLYTLDAILARYYDLE